MELPQPILATPDIHNIEDKTHVFLFQSQVRIFDVLKEMLSDESCNVNLTASERIGGNELSYGSAIEIQRDAVEDCQSLGGNLVVHKKYRWCLESDTGRQASDPVLIVITTATGRNWHAAPHLYTLAIS